MALVGDTACLKMIPWSSGGTRLGFVSIVAVLDRDLARLATFSTSIQAWVLQAGDSTFPGSFGTYPNWKCEIAHAVSPLVPSAGSFES